jgi:hypothetical protein
MAVGVAVIAVGVRFCGRAAAMEKVCNVHIVPLVENQLVKKIKPPGLKNAKLLIMRQTNNVYVAHLCEATPAALTAAVSGY